MSRAWPSCPDVSSTTRRSSSPICGITLSDCLQTHRTITANQAGAIAAAMHAPRAACWDMRVEAVCGSSAKQLSHGAAKFLAFRRGDSVAKSCVHTKFETAACAWGSMIGQHRCLVKEWLASGVWLSNFKNSTDKELSTNCARSYCPAQRLACCIKGAFDR